uniref:Uncharacterized protein n=1 Tax=Rhizophora mucronata TaxID=61149 RepID=A0A2P2MJF3_RHIMU
MDELINIQRLL